MSIFINGNVPSQKNSKRILKRGNKRFIGSSDLVLTYKAKSEGEWLLKRNTFLSMLEGLDPPFHISFRFVRDSKRKFDYTNALDTVQDCMVTHKWLTDDNCDILIPVIVPYSVNKLKPGVWIDVEDPDE